MSAAWSMLASTWLVALGWLVVLSLWATALPALALAAWRLTRPTASAPAQYRAAVTALVAAFLLPLFSLPLFLVTHPGLYTPTRPTPSAARPAVLAAPPTSPPRVAGVSAATGTDRDRGRVATLSPSVLGLVGGAWIVGASVMVGRLLFAWTAANRLGRRATLIDAGPLRATFERLSEITHVEGTSLAVSAEIDAPVALGIRAPAVLVPAHLLEYLPDEGLAPILVHELAHVARRDYAVHLAQSAIEALLFHSPATWWIGGRIREAREFCCDDVSVDVAGNRARYVEALTLVARLGTLTHTRPAVGMAGPRLITRVRRLLEGEPTMSMPIARSCLVVAAAVAAAAALPPMFTTASRHLSSQVLAAGRAQQGDAVPFGFPQRQDGSALRILGVSPADGHVCGTFEVQNVASIPIEKMRFIGILSFTAAANRPVRIVESEWVTQPIAPGDSTRLAARLVDVDLAWREGRGEHVQAFCAVREIVYANGATWGVTPHASVTRASDVLDQTRPALPRAFVGQTHAVASSPVTLCVDDKGAEYSPGAQIQIRAEPGRAARCTPEGQWVEVHASTGEPSTQAEAAADVVTLEVVVEGVTPSIALKAAGGAVATVQVAGGHTWGFVPSIAADGRVDVALHDMSTTPHRLVGTRTLQPGVTARFEDVSPAVSVRVALR